MNCNYVNEHGLTKVHTKQVERCLNYFITHKPKVKVSNGARTKKIGLNAFTYYEVMCEDRVKRHYVMLLSLMSNIKLCCCITSLHIKPKEES